MSQQQDKRRGGSYLSAVLAVRLLGAEAASKQFRHKWHLLYLLRQYFGKEKFDHCYYKASFTQPRLYTMIEKIDWAVWALLQGDDNE